MKKIVVALLFSVVILYSIIMACEPTKYSVYYLPLDANFYVPPTREYIIQHGVKFELSSCVLSDLFDIVSQQQGIKPQLADINSLRIILVNQSNGQEIIITSNKVIVFNQKKYNVEKQIVNAVLKELINYIEINKRSGIK